VSNVVNLRALRYKGKARTPRAKRQVRHIRVRKKVFGQPERPRLSVFRSLNHISAQVIDDAKGHTVAAASDLDPELRDAAKGKTKSEVAAMVGELAARRAKAAGVSQVVFDRGGFAYHGRVQTLADAARKGGLDF
jgi:large subunit ribosomal protein L18